MWVQHGEGKGPQCNYCDKKFESQSRLRRHKIHYHSEASKDKYYCDKCGLDFISRENLNTHKRLKHRKTGQHFCTKCNKEFDNGQLLNSHVRKLHPSTKPKCNICEKEYGSTTSLNHYKRQKHNAMTTTNMV